MNKLDIALKLIQLLNERNSINSKSVADLLNVSLRTAQRYLFELSKMPYVITDENEKDFKYYLNSSYKFKKALGKTSYNNNKQKNHKYNSVINIKYILIFMCSNGKYSFELPLSAVRDGNKLQNFNKLVYIIKKRLTQLKCTFS